MVVTAARTTAPSEADTLTGNGGADQFAFDVAISAPVSVENANDTEGADVEVYISSTPDFIRIMMLATYHCKLP